MPLPWEGHIFSIDIQKSIFLKSGSMVAGANKVFCGTENGVCELTKDTVYVHPSAKQCNWTPASSSPFKYVSTYTSSVLWLESSDFTYGQGMYYLSWTFTGTADHYRDLYLGVTGGEKYYSYLSYTNLGIVAENNGSGYIMVPILVIRTGSMISVSVFGDPVKSSQSDYDYTFPAAALSICTRTNSSMDPGASSNTIKMYYLQF